MFYSSESFERICTHLGPKSVRTRTRRLAPSEFFRHFSFKVHGINVGGFLSGGVNSSKDSLLFRYKYDANLTLIDIETRRISYNITSFRTFSKKTVRKLLLSDFYWKKTWRVKFDKNPLLSFSCTNLKREVGDRFPVFFLKDETRILRFIKESMKFVISKIINLLRGLSLYRS